MIRSPGAAGFNGRSAPVASSRLRNAVAASLAIGCAVAVRDRHPDGAGDQGLHGDADPGITKKSFSRSLPILHDNARWPAPQARATMKTPVVLVTIALTVAILLAASLLIAASTRGAETPAAGGLMSIRER